LHYRQTRYDRAEQSYRNARDAYRRAGDSTGEARALVGLGRLAASAGNYGEVNGYLRPALTAYRAAGDQMGEADTLVSLGAALVVMGDTEGITHLASAAALATRLKLIPLRAVANSAIALNDLYCGALDEAAERFHDVLRACGEIGYPRKEAETLRNLAEVQLERGQPLSARRFAGRALAIAERTKADWNIIGAHVTLGLAAIALGDIDDAVRHFSQAYAPRLSQVRFWYPFAMVGLATSHRLAGNPTAALKLAREALTDQRPRVRAHAHLETAEAYLALADPVSGEEHAREAWRVARRSGYRLDLARARAVLAELDRVRGATAAER
jgi:tetratricopeptide (TPR) repeat protein